MRCIWASIKPGQHGGVAGHVINLIRRGKGADARDQAILHQNISSHSGAQGAVFSRVFMSVPSLLSSGRWGMGGDPTCRVRALVRVKGGDGGASSGG